MNSCTEAVVLLVISWAACTTYAAVDFYSLTAKDIQGNEISLEQYKGQISLVVNVASECGYTDVNYRELVHLQQDYHKNGFNVLAFPCNQFGGQEPAQNQDIFNFAKENYGVNFPMFAKVDVKGEQLAAVYDYLTSATLSKPSWNFCKYLVDRDGQVVQFFTVQDDFKAIRQSISYLLTRPSHAEL